MSRPRFAVVMYHYGPRPTLAGRLYAALARWLLRRSGVVVSRVSRGVSTHA